MANPRLCKKTSPASIGESKQVDFEEEVKKYKQDIKEDIEQYKKQPYVEPSWVKKALGQKQTEARGASSSSSSWERPLTDSQAVELSDYLLTEQEAQACNCEESEEEAEYGPTWEHMCFQDNATYEYPDNLLPYGPEAYGAYWERWLAEVIAPPPYDYYQQNAAAVIAQYDKRRANK